MKKKLLATLAAGAMLALFTGGQAFAASGNSNVSVGAPTIPFAVIPVQAPNQDASTHGYFDLHMTPGQQETLHVKLVNTSNKPITLDATSADAITAANGGIEYVAATDPNVKKLLPGSFQVAQNIHLPASRIALGPKQSEELAIQVTAPNENSGTYLGGFILTPKSTTSASAGQNKGVSFSVQNKVQYAMAIEMNMPQKATENVSFKSANVSVVASGVQVQFELDNENPTISTVNNGTYDIYDSHGKSLFSGKLSDAFRMAPGADLFYPVFWNASQFSPGSYSVKITGTTDSGQNISGTQTFKVAGQQVQTFAKQTGVKAPTVLGGSNSNLMLYLAGGVGVLLLAVIGLMVVLLRKKK